MRNKKGFTLVELLAVIVVLVLIMIIVANKVGDAMLEARANALVIQVTSLSRELEKEGAIKNTIPIETVNNTVEDGNLTYLGCLKAGTKIDNSGKSFKNDIIVMQAQQGSKFANIKFTPNMEKYDVFFYKKGNSILIGDSSVKNNKEWLRQPIVYIESTVPIECKEEIIIGPKEETTTTTTTTKVTTAAKPKTYRFGEEVYVGTEKFNVLKDSGKTVNLLAASILKKDGSMQTDSTNVADYGITFETKNPNSNFGYWADGAGNLLPQYGTDYPVDIYNTAPTSNPNLLVNNKIVNVINNYVNALYKIKGIENNNSISGRLLNKNEKELIKVSQKLNYCTMTEISSWTGITQHWWTGIANSSNKIIYIYNGCTMEQTYWNESNGIRPVITIDKSLLN